MADPAGRLNPGTARGLGKVVLAILAVLAVLADTGGYDQSGSDVSRAGKERL